MISEKMNEALNVQANRELYSSYLYLSMSYYFESTGMTGFASWMRVQAGEELVHTMKMLDYVASSGGRARMMAVEAPQFSWDSPLQAFQHVWDHERVVTGLIHALVRCGRERVGCRRRRASCSGMWRSRWKKKSPRTMS